MARKIPVTIERIGGDGDGGSVEVFMKLDDFEETGATVRTDIKEFRAAYLAAIEAARRIDAPAREGRRVGTRQRWAACRILADFKRAGSSKFEIVNYVEACARDFGASLRSVRSYLDFGAHFSDCEVLDEVPFSLYAELVFRIGALGRTGRFEAEKARLAEMGRSDKIPTRDEYRHSLRSLTPP